MNKEILVVFISFAGTGETARFEIGEDGVRNIAFVDKTFGLECTVFYEDDKERTFRGPYHYEIVKGKKEKEDVL